MNRTDIKEFARRVFKGEKRPKNPQLMHPNREWSTGILVAIVLFAVPMVWSARTYLEYREVSVEAVQPDEDAVVVYRESLVETALTIFSEKEAVLDEILSNTVFVMPEAEVDEIEETASTTESGEVSAESEDVVNEDSATSTLPVNATSSEESE